jgi:hypothetical protein
LTLRGNKALRELPVWLAKITSRLGALTGVGGVT